MSIQCWKENIAPSYRFVKRKEHSGFPDLFVGWHVCSQLHMAIDLLLDCRGGKATFLSNRHYHGLIVLCMGPRYTLDRDAGHLLFQVLSMQNSSFETWMSSLWYPLHVGFVSQTFFLLTISFQSNSSISWQINIDMLSFFKSQPSFVPPHTPPARHF